MNEREMDEVAVHSQRHWERMVAEGNGFTIPWLDLNVHTVRDYATGDVTSPAEPLFQMFPRIVLSEVSGKDVLCLASGGGQQSAVFGLLGARVTVVDLSAGQLNGDQQAATKYGYDVKTVHADMRDLSSLAEDSFDLVYQGPSMSYVPDVREVYAQVARVLRGGGMYRVDFTNPANHFMEWDGDGYRITEPYARRSYGYEDGTTDFRHYFSDIFNGLIAAGFVVEQVDDHPWMAPDPAARAGSWKHEMAYNVAIVIVARRV